MKRSIQFWICLVIVLGNSLVPSDSAAQENTYVPDPDTTIRRRLEDWKDLKFGLLMHWGAYSQWGVVESWSICPEDLGWAAGARKAGVSSGYFDYLRKYEALPRTFNPVKFNPEKWAAAAHEAGMKYMVFTTKHHDGFCMFDTQYTDYKISNPEYPFSSNPRSNITKEVFNAFRKENFWIGAYFSKPDWHSDYYWWSQFPPSDRNCNYSIVKHPAQWQKFVDYTHNQIRELVSDYGKVDILWLDGGWVRKKTEEELTREMSEVYEGSRWARNPQSQDINMPLLASMARSKQPGLIIVDRAVPGEYQNYLTPEQHIPDEGLPYPWETCMTMGSSWSHVPNDIYKPANEIIEKLVDIVSKGGNYLLNIGPSAEGEFDPEAYERLKEIGVWMKTNGEAIYGTRMYSAFRDGEGIRFTRSKDNRITYIFLFDFPQGKIITSKMNLPRGAKLQMLGSSSYLSWKASNGITEIQVPSSLRKTSNHVWVIKATQ